MPILVFDSRFAPLTESPADFTLTTRDPTFSQVRGFAVKSVTYRKPFFNVHDVGTNTIPVECSVTYPDGNQSIWFFSTTVKVPPGYYSTDNIPHVATAIGSLFEQALHSYRDWLSSTLPAAPDGFLAPEQPDFAASDFVTEAMNSTSFDNYLGGISLTPTGPKEHILTWDQALPVSGVSTWPIRIVLNPKSSQVLSKNSGYTFPNLNLTAHNKLTEQFGLGYEVNLTFEQYDSDDLLPVVVIDPSDEPPNYTMMPTDFNPQTEVFVRSKRLSDIIRNHDTHALTTDGVGVDRGPSPYLFSFDTTSLAPGEVTEIKLDPSISTSAWLATGGSGADLRGQCDIRLTDINENTLGGAGLFFKLSLAVSS